MKEIFYKLKGKTKKILTTLSAAALSCAAMAVGAFAAEGETASSGNSAIAEAGDLIVEQFNNAAKDITPVIIGVLGAGLSIFIIFICIKFGKKMFKTVSNG